MWAARLTMPIVSEDGCQWLLILEMRTVTQTVDSDAFQDDGLSITSYKNQPVHGLRINSMSGPKKASSTTSYGRCREAWDRARRPKRGA